MSRRLTIVLAAALVLGACQSTEESVAVAPAPEPTVPTVEPLDLFAITTEIDGDHPQGACVTEDEMAADILARVRTEMMLIGLTCHSIYDEPTLYNRYVDFTVGNRDVIVDAQRTVGGFLGRYQRGSRARLFDTYITELANEESEVIRAESAWRYCESRRDRFFTFAEMQEPDLQAYLSEVADTAQDLYTPC